MEILAMQFATLALAVVLIRHPARSVAAALLAISALLHWYIFDDSEAVTYYVSAVTVDVATAYMLMLMDDNITLDIALLSIISACINVVGLVIWFAYFPPDVYNTSIKIIIGLQMARLLLVLDDDMAGCSWIRCWRDLVRSACLQSIGRFEVGKN